MKIARIVTAAGAIALTLGGTVSANAQVYGDGQRYDRTDDGRRYYQRGEADYDQRDRDDDRYDARDRDDRRYNDRDDDRYEHRDGKRYGRSRHYGWRQQQQQRCHFEWRHRQRVTVCYR